LRNQFETKISWSRLAALKHNKSKYKKESKGLQTPSK